MGKNYKKYWWALIIVLILPWLIDWTFSIYTCNMLSMSILTASDILTYAGVAIGFIGVIITIVLSAKQFNISNSPIIVPENKVFYLYFDEDTGKYKGEFDEGREAIRSVKGIQPRISLVNVKPIPVIDYNIKVKYKNGEYYRKIIEEIGIEPETLNIMECATWNDINYFNMGIINSHDYKKMSIPPDVFFAIDTFCGMLQHIAKGKTRVGLESYWSKKRKIAEITFEVYGELEDPTSYTYDIMLNITRRFDYKASYEVLVTYKMKK